jgi:hypothetical protein
MHYHIEVNLFTVIMKRPDLDKDCLCFLTFEFLFYPDEEETHYNARG